MAIQNRRGAYADFDPSKTKAGEFSVVQSGDPSSGDGKRVYISPTAGKAIALATLDELNTYDEDAREQAEIATQAAEDAVEAYQNAHKSNQATLSQLQTDYEKAVEDYNANAAAKTTAFNENAEDKTEDFDANAVAQTSAFNQNASEKLSAYNDNDTAKTEAYNLNDSTKLSEYNENAAAKLAELNAAAATAEAYMDSAVEEVGEAVETVNKKASDIVKVTTDADTVAMQALDKAGEVENYLAETSNTLDTLTDAVQALQLASLTHVDDAYVDDDGKLHLTNNGDDICEALGPFAGGGGGGGGTSGNAATLTVSNVSGFNAITIAEGSDVNLQILWSSVEEGYATGNGTATITVNGVTKQVSDISQGTVTFNVKDIVAVGSNIVKIKISDIYDNNRSISFTVTVVSISISSTFDPSTTYQGAISFPFTPVGSVAKTIHFILDGNEIGTTETSVSGRQMSFTIPAQSHGAHTFECYFDATINGATVVSNTLYYEILCTEALNYTPIIASSFNSETVSQYSTIQIEYLVYDPDSLTADIELKVNGSTVNSLTVDRTKQVWSYRADTAGALTLAITCGTVTKSWNITVSEVSIEAAAETRDLALYLSSYGRSNNEANPLTWTYTDSSGTTISSVFSGFNLITDGWQTDDDGITCLRVANGASVEIGFKPFASDCRSTGLTIELEYATHDTRDLSAEIISCWSGERGIKITAQEAALKSALSSMSRTFSDDTHLRLSFVIQKRVEKRLIRMFIDGIECGDMVYPDTDDFQQASPVNISITSDDCAVDLYCIRVYNNSLTTQQIEDNWIADCQDGEEMLDRYSRNSIMDAYGQIVIDKLPKTLPYMIITCPELPETKTDEKTCSVVYVDPVNTSKSFTATGVTIKCQGTSSLAYVRKNYKMKYGNGFEIGSTHADKYALRTGSIPEKTFTMKADVASSEGANNVELVRYYNDLCTYKTPPQRTNSAVRQGIDGFPIVIFWNDGNTTTFLGKYNFNNDKGTENTFGFTEGDESWETLNNTNNRSLFLSDDFTSLDSNGNPAWLSDYEGRYPDGNEDGTNLQAFISAVVNADNTAFKAMADSTYSLSDAIFYRIFIEQFYMIDSKGKNSFPTLWHDDGLWGWLPYDFDTAIGINNEGTYVYGYWLETGDDPDNFNAKDHRFWKMLDANFASEIKSAYTSLRSNGFNADTILEMFDEHQAIWPERIWNEDTKFKYLDPYTGTKNDSSYLPMSQGNKKSVRTWWVKNRFAYMDSKYCTADATISTNRIRLRAYAHHNITLTSFVYGYLNVMYGSRVVSCRTDPNVAHTLVNPDNDMWDTEVYVYSASTITNVGDLSPMMVGEAVFTYATKLTEIKLGDSSSSYTNTQLLEIHLGNLPLLKKLDCRNCVNLGTGTMAVIDISGCQGIEELYFENTQITGVDLANSSMLETLHLPATTASLILRNQSRLTDLSIAAGAVLTTIWFENLPDTVDPWSYINSMPDNSRLRWTGFSYEESDLDIQDGESAMDAIFALMDLWDKHRGLDENGNTTDQAQISGTFHISEATGAELAEAKSRYPYVTINADHSKCYVYYWNYDGTNKLYTEEVLDGGNATYTGKPSRSSTAQYNYTFAGWARTANGSVWSAAQTAITEDRNLYAAYTASVRYYTVTIYTKGGTASYSPVSTQTVAYGGYASYNASSDTDENGNAFMSWSPALGPITGDTSCYAQYVPPLEETISEDWDQIIKWCEAGTILEHYALGDTKIVNFGSDCGMVAMQLVATDMDILADGSNKKANTTWISQNVGKTTKKWNDALATLYSWVADSDSGGWKTNNQNKSSSTASATWTINPSTTGTATLSYKVGSEANYDKLTIKIDGSTVVNAVSGDIDWTDYALQLSAGTAVTITASYTKDNSTDSNGDTCYIKFTGVDSSDITFDTYSGYVSGTGTIGGYEQSYIRSYVSGLYDNLPSNLQKAIKPVTKYSRGYTTSGSASTMTSTEKVWIPDYYEVYSKDATNYPVYYTDFFTSDDKRVKCVAGSTSGSYWWLRRADSANYAYYITSGGGGNNYYVIVTYGVVPGFCI